MIYGCSQPRELWFIDFNTAQIPRQSFFHKVGFDVRIQVYIYTMCDTARNPIKL